MKIILKHYLERLDYDQEFKPEDERLKVPSVAELAKDIEVTRAHLYKLMNNEAKVLNMKHAERILRSMRRRGFPMEVGDLLEYRD